MSTEKHEEIKKWLAQYLAIDYERPDWLIYPRGMIKKATLTFMTILFRLLVGHRLSHRKAHNVLTWHRAVMVAALVAGLEINFAKLMLAVIQRAYMTSTTYPFLSLIFQLCRDVGVTIWTYERQCRQAGTVDIGLIKDEANVAAPHRGSRIKFPPLTEN